MKIRTDFVTNSSSSSFVTINIVTEDGNVYKLDNCDTNSDLYGDNLLEVQGNALLYSDHENSTPISNVIDLMACIYFAQSEEILPFEVCSNVFAFLIGMISPTKLQNKLEKHDEFECLENIDPDDYTDKEEMREAIIELLSECLEEIGCTIDINDDSVLEQYKHIITSIVKLSDIKKIEFITEESNFGEFTNIYSEMLTKVLSRYKFAPIDVNDIAYQEQYNTWLKLLKNKVFDTYEFPSESFEELVKKALASGDPYDMIPSSVLTKNIVSLDIPCDIVCDAAPIKNVRKSVFKYDEVTNINFDSSRNFCITGSEVLTEDQWTSMIYGILKNKGIFAQTVSQKTKYLIACEQYDSKTTKYLDAVKLKKNGHDIKIISEKQFFKLVKVESFNILSDEEIMSKISQQTKFVELAQNIKIIPCQLFYKNTVVESINMPDDIFWICSDAFRECENLKEIKLSMSLLEIRNRAFLNCKKLVNITIPNKVFHICSSAFKGCSSLENVFIYVDDVIFGQEVFSDCPKLKIHAPKGSTAHAYAKQHNIQFEVIKMTVLETIIQSLKNLGGKAKYSEIYQEYEYISQCKLSVGQKAGIRKLIETHSSDSDVFNKKEDIFYSVKGKGKGFWGLR